ncbi:hypothetical protein ACFXDH_38115 [Streptomyces sp. NPDC059467]|uniref:hypothetical protein n=1 Tax=Streptomyces sp. NPDC059467 TaxID=3346844 RepID=UPI0036BC8545
MGTYKYSAEFRADAVTLARSSGRPVSRISGRRPVRLFRNRNRNRNRYRNRNRLVPQSGGA